MSISKFLSAACSLAVCLGAALICGSAGNLRVLARQILPR